MILFNKYGEWSSVITNHANLDDVSVLFFLVTNLINTAIKIQNFHIIFISDSLFREKSKYRSLYGDCLKTGILNSQLTKPTSLDPARSPL